MQGIDIFEENSPKKKIFNILVENKELSAKEIHNILKRQFAINHSYQATYKILQQLVESQIIKKKGLRYKINLAWIIKQQNYLESITSIINKTNNCTYTSEFIRIYKFFSLKAVDAFIQSTVLKINKKDNANTTYWKTPHCWWLLTNPLDEDEAVGKYENQELKSIALINSTTRLDKVAKKYYDLKPESYTACYLRDVKDKEITQVIGEYSIIFDMPTEILQELDAIYELKKTSEILPAILELVSRTIPLEVKIIKDKTIAQAHISEITKEN